MHDPLPITEFAFPGPLRDALLAAIRDGSKTSTSSLLREYEIDDEPLPTPGTRCATVDSDGRFAFVVETTGVDVVRLADVPLQHALDEGEGYRSVAEWRRAHEAFWTSPEMTAALGAEFVLDDDTPVVLERIAFIPSA